MDVLSDVLRTIRLEGALFLNGEMRAPWCVKVPPSAHVAQMLKPGAHRLAICHLVLEGGCWAQAEGEAPVRVEAGEGHVIPPGEPPHPRSGPEHPATDVH